MPGSPGNRTARLRLVAAAMPHPGPTPRFPGPEDGVGAVDVGAAVLERVGRWTSAIRAPDGAARATAAALGAEAATVEPALAAPSYGDWSGRPVEEVLAADPEGVARWRADPTWAPPGGESLAELSRRVGAWLAGRLGDDRPLVVADAAVVRAAVLVALEAEPASSWHLDVGPLTVVRLHAHDGTWRLRALHPA